MNISEIVLNIVKDSEFYLQAFATYVTTGTIFFMATIVF